MGKLHLTILTDPANILFIYLGGSYAQGSQKNSKTTHYESRIQSNSRADFKLNSYRENYGKF